MDGFSLRLAAKRWVKRAAITAALEAIAWTRAARLMPAAAGRGVIFTLHHVRPQSAEDFQPNELLSVTPEFLDAAIRAVMAEGFTPIHLDDLPGRLADPADKRRFVMFTLDDGYHDNFQYAWPVFKAHGVPFTIFITAGFIERTRSLWWITTEELIRKLDTLSFDFGNGRETISTRSRLEKLAAFERVGRYLDHADEDNAVAAIDTVAHAVGIDPLAIVEREIMTQARLRELVADPLARLGAHTLTHPNLARVSAQRLTEELVGSADKVAAYVGQRPVTLAYPYGGPSTVGPREFQAAQDCGFHVAVTTQPGMLGAKSLGMPTALNRISLNGFYQKARYAAALASGIPFVFR